MTENKRFYKGDYTNCWYDICEIEKDEEIICTVALKDAEFIIEIFEENEKLEKENEQLKQQAINVLEELKENINDVSDFDDMIISRVLSEINIKIRELEEIE